MSYNGVCTADELKPNDACSTHMHTAGTAAAMQFYATAESKAALFHVMGENHKVPTALLVTVFHVFKTESAIKAECPPESSPDGKQGR